MLTQDLKDAWIEKIIELPHGHGRLYTKTDGTYCALGALLVTLGNDPALTLDTNQLWLRLYGLLGHDKTQQVYAINDGLVTVSISEPPTQRVRRRTAEETAAWVQENIPVDEKEDA